MSSARLLQAVSNLPGDIKGKIVKSLFEGRFMTVIKYVHPYPNSEDCKLLLKNSIKMLDKSGKIHLDHLLQYYLDWDDETYEELVSSGNCRHDEMVWLDLVCQCVEKNLRDKLIITLRYCSSLNDYWKDKLAYDPYVQLNQELVDFAKRYGFIDRMREGMSPPEHVGANRRLTRHRLFHNYEQNSVIFGFADKEMVKEEIALLKKNDKGRYDNFVKTCYEKYIDFDPKTLARWFEN